jgi:hypothetical protein
MTQTKQSPRKRPHWLKYTGRQEIEQALTERQQDRWRREQRPRRLLVLAMALVAVALALSSFIAHDDVRLPSVVLLWLVVIVLYFKLLNSVRQVPYAPDDLLDERQLALRDSAHKVAYHILGWLIFGGLVIMDVTFLLGGQLAERFWDGVGSFYLALSISLPAMVLAWRLPEEPRDEMA